MNEEVRELKMQTQPIGDTLYGVAAAAAPEGV